MELLFLACAVSVVGLTGATCSPCPFQWSQRGAACYRYVDEALSCGAKATHCPRYRRSGRLARTSGLRETGSLEVLTEAVSLLPDLPRYVWLGPADVAEDAEVLPILRRSLGPLDDVTPCDQAPAASEQYTILVDEGAAALVPGPDGAATPCSVHVTRGSYLDLGDFGGTCVSDPERCASNSTTWSVWLKSDVPRPTNDIQVYLSTGGQTQVARGTYLAYALGEDTFGVSTKDRYHWDSWRYSASNFPTNEWFHLAYAVEFRRAEGTTVRLYVNGVPVVHDSVQSHGFTDAGDGCTQLRLAHTNSCPTAFPATVYGTSAAFSDLLVFDAMLTSSQVKNLYACAEADVRLEVLAFNATADDVSGDVTYECTARGISITWEILQGNSRRVQLGASSGPGYEVQAQNVSRCLVRSTLTIPPGGDLPQEGAVVTCTAKSHDASRQASARIFHGNGVVAGIRDGDTYGVLWNSGESNQTSGGAGFSWSSPPAQEPCQEQYPFLCELDLPSD